MNVVTPFEGIGASVRRKEDRRFLSGRGQYTDDINRPGQAYAAILRSPHPHARIRAIDTAAAAGMPGVVAVFTCSPARTWRTPASAACPAAGRSTTRTARRWPSRRIR
jgi:CO/xanthine dehydrogenase Mo-binding subunit